MTRLCAVAMLIPGMLGPGNPASNAELPTLYAPIYSGGSCPAVHRELRFGWVDIEDEIPPPPGRVGAVCLAVYQTLE